MYKHQNTIVAPVLRDRDGLAVIGRTRHDLTGIRYGEGEGGNGGAGEGGQAASAAAGGEGAAQGGEQKPPWGDDPTKFDPNKAWGLIQAVRGDLAAEKAKREQAIQDAVAQAQQSQKDQLAQLGRLLTGEQEPETDPAKLQASLAALQGTVTEKDTAIAQATAAAKSGAVALQVALLAPGLGANPALLLTNEQFKTSVASVEPTDEAALKAAITKALQANAALKATPSRSGSGEHIGAQIQSLEAQLAEATKRKDWTETVRLKQAIAAAKA